MPLHHSTKSISAIRAAGAIAIQLWAFMHMTTAQQNPVEWSNPQDQTDCQKVCGRFYAEQTPARNCPQDEEGCGSHQQASCGQACHVRRNGINEGTCDTMCRTNGESGTGNVCRVETKEDWNEKNVFVFIHPMGDLI